jgi:hypothetical protein
MSGLWRRVAVPQYEDIRLQLTCSAAISGHRVAYDLDYSSCGELIKWFSDLDLQVHRAWVITVAPRHATYLHTDWGGDHSGWALNFPLYNCSTSVTEFWHTSQDTATEIVRVREEPGTSGFTRFIPNGSEQLIDQFVLDSAVLLNIQVPHRVRNFSKDIRVCASFRFQQDPKRLLES